MLYMCGAEQHVTGTNRGYLVRYPVTAGAGRDEIEFVSLMRNLWAIRGSSREPYFQISVKKHLGRSPRRPREGKRGCNRHWRRRVIHREFPPAASRVRYRYARRLFPLLIAPTCLAEAATCQYAPYLRGNHLPEIHLADCQVSALAKAGVEISTPSRRSNRASQTSPVAFTPKPCFKPALPCRARRHRARLCPLPSWKVDQTRSGAETSHRGFTHAAIRNRAHCAE
jgi:hypothetical protein